MTEIKLSRPVDKVDFQIAVLSDFETLAESYTVYRYDTVPIGDRTQPQHWKYVVVDGKIVAVNF